MLRELFTSITTSCPPHLRKMGHLHELIAIGARHERWREAWRPHLENCRATILEATEGLSRRRRVVAFGAGHWFDLPVAELSARFGEVWLVDVVHLRGQRRDARRYANVRLVDHDVTGVLEPVYRLREAARRARVAGGGERNGLPGGSRPGVLEGIRPGLPGGIRPGLPDVVPMAFLEDQEIDLVISSCLLSQLAILPVRWIEGLKDPKTGAPLYAEEELEAFENGIARRHLEYLRRFQARVCLITELERLGVDRGGRVVEREEIEPRVSPPAGARSWVWEMAPAPELDPEIGYHLRMVGLPDLEAAFRSGMRAEG